jgi:hypothetical protein
MNRQFQKPKDNSSKNGKALTENQLNYIYKTAQVIRGRYKPIWTMRPLNVFNLYRFQIG